MLHGLDHIVHASAISNWLAAARGASGVPPHAAHGATLILETAKEG
jgi:hypothetical protein